MCAKAEVALPLKPLVGSTAMWEMSKALGCEGMDSDLR
jgi:hypothetical protein